MREKPVASRMQTYISSEKDTSGSDGTEDESVDEESDSDNSCENEDGDVQEKYSSSKESEKSLDDGSSATTSEVDISIQPKEGSKKGYKESSTHTHPLPRISSSPSTAQQEYQPQPKERRHRKRENDQKKRKKGRNKSEASSETGDSSPECDMLKNVSEAEKEKLLGIYRRFFGKLCCAVLNPVQIAAQLQEKCLISQAMMKDLIMSPESQQAKTISVVDALEKKIKLDPDHLFVFIEVLLENDSPELQKTGGEILREADKVCPEKTAARFLRKPQSTEVVATSMQALGSEREVQVRLPEKGEESTPKVMGTSKSGDLKVSQSVSKPSISPVLKTYKEYLQSCYSARVLAPADKYLPTLQVPYINLAMVGRDEYDHDIRDEFTRQTLHGGVDEILESKTPISIEHLLTPKQGRKPVKFILVEGPPGIGKSTFAWEVCRRWDEIESLRAYHVIVLLKLREKWVLNATSLTDLFRYPIEPELCKNIAQELHGSQGDNLFLVLDGFDEVSHSFHENSVIKSILCKQLLPQCTIILTTRPSAKHMLKPICQPAVDKHVEIIGFTEEERVRYITEVFSKEPKLQMDFLKYMFLVPHIKSMMYIPFNCAIIAQVYYESQGSRHLAIPKTRTQLYKALTHSLLVRHMRTKECDYQYTSMLPEGLSADDMKRFKILAKFAFDSYHSSLKEYDEESISKVTFFKEDIPEGLVHFGFMNESTEMYASRGVESIFAFLHLSLQEYLAAWHVATHCSIDFQVAYHRLAVGKLTYGDEKEDEKDLLLSLKDKWESLREPAIFLTGITGWKSLSGHDKNPWESYLSHDTADVEDSSLLLSSLYEAQNPTIVSHYFVSNESRRELVIDSDLTPYECYSLSYCIVHSSEELSLSVKITDEDEVSLIETFVKGFDDSSNTVIPKVRHFKVLIEVDSYDGSMKCLFWLTKPKFLANLEEFFFACESIDSDLAYRLLQSVVKLRVLKIHIDSSASLEWLIILKSLSMLQELELCINLPINDICCFVPVDIKKLTLSCKSMDSALMQSIIRSLVKINELTIDIESSKCREWLDALNSLNELQNFDLSIRSPVSVIYSSQRITFRYEFSSDNDTLADYKNISKLFLKCNPITHIYLTNVSHKSMVVAQNILLHCPCLQSLELKKTKLGYDGIIYICTALQTNKTLTHLVIDDDLQLPPSRSISPWGKLALTSFLKVEKLPLPAKTTCTDCLLQLNNILKGNTTLKVIKIKSGLFLPLSAGVDGEYCQWTGLGPFQQFNVGAVSSGMSPNLRRSFSSSDLTQPQTTLFWDKQFSTLYFPSDVDFKKLFLQKKKEGKKLYSLTSFTAPDTEILRSFSDLDPRLRDCLEISHPHQYVQKLKWSYCGLVREIAAYVQQHAAN